VKVKIKAPTFQVVRRVAKKRVPAVRKKAAPAGTAWKIGINAGSSAAKTAGEDKGHLQCHNHFHAAVKGWRLSGEFVRTGTNRTLTGFKADGKKDVFLQRRAILPFFLSEFVRVCSSGT
jgi:hypothetical protein